MFKQLERHFPRRKKPRCCKKGENNHVILKVYYKRLTNGRTKSPYFYLFGCIPTTNLAWQPHPKKPENRSVWARGSTREAPVFLGIETGERMQQVPTAQGEPTKKNPYIFTQFSRLPMGKTPSPREKKRAPLSIFSSSLFPTTWGFSSADQTWCCWPVRYFFPCTLSWPRLFSFGWNINSSIFFSSAFVLALLPYHPEHLLCPLWWHPGP